MHRPDGLVGVGHALAQGADEIAVEFGNRIADRVRNVERRGAFLDHGLEHAAEKVNVAAVAVFRAELDVVHQVASEAHRLHRLLQHLLGRHAQFLLHVQRTGGNEGVNAGALSSLERLRGARDVSVVGPCQ